MTSRTGSGLILGSSSPRRLDLLRQVLIEPVAILAPDVDETPAAEEHPRRYVERMALAKMAAVQSQSPTDQYVVAADTVVACGRRILGKAENAGEAAKFLRLLSGRRHRVYGGIAVGLGLQVVRRVVQTQVSFKRLSEADIAFYLATEEWRGKAGAYAIQGVAAAFIASISGSYTNVVGLPVVELLQLLHGLGWRRSGS